jgi:hypothetical protein
MEALQQVRVLLAGMSNMLSNIITGALAQAPDIVVTGQVGKDADLAAEVRGVSADGVIVQTSQPEAGEVFAPLLRIFPALRVLAIDAAGRNGFVHELRLFSIPVAELSADVLQSALRARSAPPSRD